jgi:hypothetical protein
MFAPLLRTRISPQLCSSKPFHSFCGGRSNYRSFLVAPRFASVGRCATVGMLSFPIRCFSTDSSVKKGAKRSQLQSLDCMSTTRATLYKFNRQKSYPILYSSRRHFIPGGPNGLRLAIQLLQQFGPYLMRLGPALPVVLGIVVFRIIPLLGLAIIGGVMIQVWETTSLYTKLAYGVIFLVTYLCCHGLGLLWNKSVVQSEAQTFKLVNVYCGFPVSHATDAAEYPKWEDKPIVLSPSSSNLSLNSSGLILTTTWEAYLPKFNRITPGSENKVFVVASMRVPSESLVK